MLIVIAMLTLAPAKGRARRPPPTVECSNPDSDQKTVLTIAKVKQSVARLKKKVVKKGIALLDMAEDVQQRRTRLTADLAAKDWCVVANHVKAIEEELALTRIDETFVGAKFTRLERWAQSGMHSLTAARKAELLMTQAAAKLAARDFAATNKLLNRALQALFGLRSLFDVPKELPGAVPVSASGRKSVRVDDEEVEDGCPGIFDKGSVSLADLEQAVRSAGKILDQRRLRPYDLTKGPQLVEDLVAYRKIKAVFPAMRAACALVSRAAEASIDLGLTMGRFRRVNRLRDEQGIPADKEARFKDLVRLASDAIAAQQFDSAHAHLEDLVILMGEPSRPSASLQ